MLQFLGPPNSDSEKQYRGGVYTAKVWGWGTWKGTVAQVLPAPRGDCPPPTLSPQLSLKTALPVVARNRGRRSPGRSFPAGSLTACWLSRAHGHAGTCWESAPAGARRPGSCW